MLIPIKKGKTFRQCAAEVNIDVDTWLPSFLVFSDDEMIVLTLNSDIINNPITLLSVKQRASAINKFLGIPIDICERITKDCFIRDTKSYLARKEYRTYQPDVKRILYTAGSLQAMELADEITNLRLNLSTFDDKEDKTFERIQKYITELYKTIDGIDKAEKSIRTEEEEILIKNMTVTKGSILNTGRKKAN